MKKRLVAILLIVFVLMLTGCGNSDSAEESTGADGRITENEPDELFSIEGTVLEVNETNILINESGYENGECYLTISDDTAISLDGEKVVISMIKAGQIIKAIYTGGIDDMYPSRIGGVKEVIAEYPSATEGNIATGEDMITFDGVIIDNTIDTLVPTICVKPLLDEITCDALFFELPDNEVEWASKINSIITITCADIFTEQTPHYGTLISITGLTTEADNYLISVASLWDRENTARLSPEDAAVIADFVEGGNWMEGTSDCMDDYIIFMDGEEIHYHSDCGTFNDTVNEKRLHLTEEQQTAVNDILEKHIVLNAEINAILEE